MRTTKHHDQSQVKQSCQSLKSIAVAFAETLWTITASLAAWLATLSIYVERRSSS